jgi:hypothetical protein
MKQQTTIETGRSSILRVAIASSHGPRWLGALAGCLLAACGADPAEPEELLGVAELAIAAPPGVGSVQIEFQGATRGLSRCVAVDGSPTTRLDKLPSGAVTVNAAAFAGSSCEGDVTWYADEQPEPVRLIPGRPVPIQLVFRPNGIAEIGTNFVGDGACADESIVASWSEEFSEATLDPAWDVWEYTGERHNSQTSPANHFLLDGSGALRYYVDPMTYAAAWHNYEPYFASPFYWYDPGVSIERELGGSRWSVEFKAEYFVPNVVNSAQHEVAIRLEQPDGSALHCAFDRFSNDDVNAGSSHTNNTFFATCSLDGVSQGETFTEWAGLDTSIVRFVRFAREAEILSIQVSTDGTSWNDAISVDIPEEVSCAPQRLMISGAAWFSPQGSFADYDYVRFARTAP